MKVCVIGTGYVGLVAGACFAECGNDVICVDIDQAKIDKLNKGIIPIYEPGLEEIVKKNMKDGRLSFATELGESVKKSLFVFIAVGTPSDKDGSADLNAVLSVAREIGKNLNSFKIIVDKSTVPVGTADKVKAAIKEVSSQEFDVVSNPEFLKEGAAIDDFMKPDRIVIGADNIRTAELMKELYSPLNRTSDRVLVMDVRSAEMTKYAANAMLATRITFMNEIANLCERVGANVDWVRKGIGTDSRIGSSFLFPGVGYGGSCFPKDVKAVIATARENGYNFKILEMVEEVNNEQKKRLGEKIIAYFSEKHPGKKDFNGFTIGIWGLAFKPKTDDMREAPSIVVIDMLLKKGFKVQAYDPEAMDVAKGIFGDKITYSKSDYETLKNADALAIITEWNEFRRPDFDKIKSLLKSPLIFDGRNIYDPAKMREMGFEYFSIGRGCNK